MARHVTRHEIDLALARRMLESNRRSFPAMVARLKAGDSGELYSVSRHALRLARGLAVLDPESKEVDSLLRLAARTDSAQWALVHSDGRALEYPATTDGPERIEGKIDESLLSVGEWLTGYWLATLTGDQLSLATLCYAPTDVWQRSRTKNEHYTHLFADAMRKYWLRDETAGEALVAALRATDPKALRWPDLDWVLDIDVPLIEVALRVFSLDAVQLDEALAKAYELHKKYWSAGDRATDRAGWLAIELAALTMLARSQGIAPATTSDYAPRALLDALEQAAPRELVLCPYCIAPIANGVTMCATCLEDPRNDAVIESSVDDFTNAEGKRCGTCATRIHHLAARCPACRTRQ